MEVASMRRSERLRQELEIAGIHLGSSDKGRQNPVSSPFVTAVPRSLPKIAITCECGTPGHIGVICLKCETTIPDLPWMVGPVLTRLEAAKWDAIRIEANGYL